MSWSPELSSEEKEALQDPHVVRVRKRYKAFSPESALCIQAKKRKTFSYWSPLNDHDMKTWLLSVVNPFIEKKTASWKEVWLQSPVAKMVELQCKKYQENAWSVALVLVSMLTIASKEKLQIGLVRKDQGHMYVIQDWNQNLCFFNLKGGEKLTMGDLRFQIPQQQAEDLPAFIMGLFPVIIEVCNHPEEWVVGLRKTNSQTNAWNPYFQFSSPLVDWSQEVCSRLLRTKF